MVSFVFLVFDSPSFWCSIYREIRRNVMTKLTMALTVAFVFFFCTASLTAKALDVKLEEVANKLTAPLLLVEAQTTRIENSLLSR